MLTQVMPNTSFVLSNEHPAMSDLTHDRIRRAVERYHLTISVLSNVVLGFDLLGGTTLEQANRVVALLNENVLDVFLTARQMDVVPDS